MELFLVVGIVYSRLLLPALNRLNLALGGNKIRETKFGKHKKSVHFMSRSYTYVFVYLFRHDILEVCHIRWHASSGTFALFEILCCCQRKCSSLVRRWFFNIFFRAVVEVLFCFIFFVYYTAAVIGNSKTITTSVNPPWILKHWFRLFKLPE